MTPTIVFDTYWRFAAERLAMFYRRISGALAGRREEFDVAHRDHSTHEIAGVSPQDTIRIYEPNGRIEFDSLPAEACQIASAAVQRHLPQIRQLFPSVSFVDDWIYLEYGPSQFVTSHVDYPIDDDHPDHPKYAAISVVLIQSERGGEFFIETCGDPGLWREDRLVDNCNSNSAWFRALHRTRWTTRVEPGDALCWGTQVIHGTLPVESGRVGKLLGLLY